jgi:rhodanese-related sulfurtransferase
MQNNLLNKGEKIIMRKSIIICCVAALFVVFVALAPLSLQGREKRVLKSISVEEAAQLIETNGQNPDFIILDIRTPQEFASGHLEGAVNIDYYSESFTQELNALDKSKTYLMYCRSGGRSARALQSMKSLGFTEVYEMSEGISTWIEKGYHAVK